MNGLVRCLNGLVGWGGAEQKEPHCISWVFGSSTRKKSVFKESQQGGKTSWSSAPFWEKKTLSHLGENNVEAGSRKTTNQLRVQAECVCVIMEMQSFLLPYNNSKRQNMLRMRSQKIQIKTQTQIINWFNCLYDCCSFIVMTNNNNNKTSQLR